MCSIGWTILGLFVCPRSIWVRGRSDVRTPFYYRVFADMRSVVHASAEQQITILADGAPDLRCATENGLHGHFQTKYDGRPTRVVVAIGSTALHVLGAMSALVPCRPRELCHD